MLQEYDWQRDPDRRGSTLIKLQTVGTLRWCPYRAPGSAVCLAFPETDAAAGGADLCHSSGHFCTFPWWTLSRAEVVQQAPLPGLSCQCWGVLSLLSALPISCASQAPASKQSFHSKPPMTTAVIHLQSLGSSSSSPQPLSVGMPSSQTSYLSVDFFSMRGLMALNTSEHSFLIYVLSLHFTP